MVFLKALWPSLLLAGTVHAAKWTITSVFVQTVTEYTYTDRFPDSTTTVTSKYTRNTGVTLKPSVTITATPITATTSTSSYYYYYNGQEVPGDGSDDVVYIKRYYPSGAIATSDLTSSTYRYNQRDYTSTYFFQTIEYTAPTSCPTPFTVTTTSRISVPSQVVDQVSIRTATTSVSSNEYGGSDGYTYTFVSAYLASTSHPSGAAATLNYYYREYLTSCINPNPNPTRTYSPRPTSGGRSGSDGDDSDIDGFLNGTSTCAWSNCSNTPYWGVFIVTILPAVFLLGFLESYFWFTCLMSGKGALRVGTVSWILLCLPTIFLTRRIPARSLEDQERLRAQWMEKSFGQRFSLWAHWGLRYRYPMELLGVHPKYAYGNPAEDEKLVDDWYGENGDNPQVPATYMYQHEARQVSMAPALAQSQSPSQSQAPQLPPRVRLSGRSTRSVPSETHSHLASVPEELVSSSGLGKGKGKEVQQTSNPEVQVSQNETEVGRAPRIEDEVDQQTEQVTTKEAKPEDKGQETKP
ncbi:hypothetical protein VFPPC_11047 [Pochonia chlamydosporia 170]|uniref:Uncharacterized protein n=1 Tax=Pochonia chlamydosporia 170 TaxID=1380566 RepID=A0A179F1C3_METCM|nr:hypothetical protein VFPPC_11047 [Pochonia chlamydosporia 170]OAQ58863.1 hypothetical protein VFPPC_11047 [Pochonia chlamydosporia 170]